MYPPACSAQYQQVADGPSNVKAIEAVRVMPTITENDAQRSGC